LFVKDNNVLFSLKVKVRQKENNILCFNTNNLTSDTCKFTN